MSRKNVETVDDANNALYEIALAQIELSKIDTAAQEEITHAQKRAEVEGKSFREKIEGLEAKLISFAEAKKTELFDDGKKKRSIDLTFGDIGFRKSSRIEVESDAKTIEQIEITKKKLADKLGLDHVIVREPKINKAALKKFDDETLVKFGIERKYEDTFYYNTDLDAVNLQLQNNKSA